MASEVGAAQDSVVLASFANRHAAERTLASLKRGFRKKARKGEVAAFVVSGNTDGSLKLTQSRVVTAGNVGSALIHVSASMMVGLMGLGSMLKGAKRGGHAVHVHKAHVGSDDHAAHAILAKAGPDAAVALICCKDEETRHTVTARFAERSSYSWDGPRTEFLADLDPGSKHDWVRTALGEPSSVKR
jgi:hypothetical protein